MTADTETTRFPLTVAQIYLDEHGARLTAELDAAHAAVRESISQQTVADLKATAERLRINIKGKTTKDDIVAIIADRVIRDTDQHAALRDARSAAFTDRQADERVQALLDRGTELATKTAEEAAKGIHMLRSHLQWSFSEIAAIAYAAQYAAQWQQGRDNGTEPKDLARRMGNSALSAVLMVVGNTSNLRVDGHGVDRVAEAAGARAFLQAIATVLPDEYAAVV